MLDIGFTFDGKHSKEIGVELQEPIRVTAAQPRVDKLTVPGRSGTIVRYDGTFDNRTATAKCYTVSDELSNRIGELDRWLIGKEGYRRLVLDEDPDHYYLARPVGGVEVDRRGNVLNAFEITFDLMPQRYLKDGDTPESWDKITSGYEVKLENPTAYAASPLIRFDGLSPNSKTSLQIEGESGDRCILSYTSVPDLIYDAHEDEAYNDSGRSLNQEVETINAIVLYPGVNKITVSGFGNYNERARKLTITPRWWEI
jgi:predicted phage tail component-like protein